MYVVADSLILLSRLEVGRISGCSYNEGLSEHERHICGCHCISIPFDLLTFGSFGHPVICLY
jgi:hypothetical protein